MYSSYRNSPTDALRNIYGNNSSAASTNQQLASSATNNPYCSPATSNLMTTNTSSTLGLNRMSHNPYSSPPNCNLMTANTSSTLGLNRISHIPYSSPATCNLMTANTSSTLGLNRMSHIPYSSPATSNLMMTNTSSTLGLNRMSPPPIRRYSYSGLPSSTSINDYVTLPISDNAANISSLITETCQSISRSSNILNRQLSADMALNNPCYTSLSNLIDENIQSDIVKYDLLNDITTTANVAPIKYTNFYSQPTIADRMMFMPTATTSYFNRNPPLSTNRLITDDYLLSKPIFSKDNNRLTSSYVNDDYYTQPFNTPSYHYASNPCLSSLTYTQPYNHFPLSNSSFNRNYYPSYHQPQFTSRPPSISSLNRYTTYSNNYASSFNPQPYYRTGSRLDLDNPKNNEIKRQVSFKFDVDQMSFDP